VNRLRRAALFGILCDISLEGGIRLAVYLCSKCLFAFERTGQVENCPDCGNINVREADAKETAEYRRIREELRAARGEKQPV
jgi:uncharacterized Zn finger protein (UPF0148 family)